MHKLSPSALFEVDKLLHQGVVHALELGHSLAQVVTQSLKSCLSLGQGT